MESDKNKRKKPPNPRASANPLSAITFSWLIGVFYKGFKKDFEVEDLYEPLEEHKSEYLGDIFERYWENELQFAKNNKRPPKFSNVIIRAFWKKNTIYSFVLVFGEIIRLLQPFFIGLLVRFFSIDNSNFKYPSGADPTYIARIVEILEEQKSRITKNEAIFYAGAIVLISLITVSLTNPYMLAVYHQAMKMRVATSSLIYRKALKLRKSVLGKTTVGQIVNLLSNDVNRFERAVTSMHYLWIGPVQTVLVTYFMYLAMGWPSLLGVLFLLLLLPSQAYLGKKMSEFRLRTAIRTDERIRLMNEIISGMQVIKMYAWETPFSQLVALARKKETNQIRWSAFGKAILASFLIFITRFSIFVTILAYVLLGNIISADKVFVLTAFYNILRQPMTVYFPRGITRIAEVLISIKRIQEFLLYEENSTFIRSNKDENGTYNGIYENSVAIKFDNVTCKWIKAHERTLHNVSISIAPGKILAVIGPVAAGKSSLLNVILKELPVKSGSLTVNGAVSYASQEPWLFPGSIRQNILFGMEYDRQRYNKIVNGRKLVRNVSMARVVGMISGFSTLTWYDSDSNNGHLYTKLRLLTSYSKPGRRDILHHFQDIRVIEICALKKDFTLFPYGDKTIVGERGISLSGGQRARINLARAVYKDADIYLLDDPLSAVDTHVGKHLFEECIIKFLKGKTVILVTHQLQYLESVDQIVILYNGHVQSAGTFKDLRKSGLDLGGLLHKPAAVQEEIIHKNDSVVPDKRSSAASSVSTTSNNNDEPAEVKEHRKMGFLKWNVYIGYAVAIQRWFLVFLTFFLFILTQTIASVTDYWPSKWSRDEEINHLNRTNMTYEEKEQSTYENLYIFSGFSIATVFVTLIRSILFSEICLMASKNLHDNMFSNIVCAPMRFFHTNHSGRILNRFSEDMGIIDELLPISMVGAFQISLQIIGIVVLVAVSSPNLLILIAIVSLMFYLLRVVYIKTSTSIKRLEGVTRSPVFMHLTASIQGLTTIRAFNAQKILEKEFDHHQNLHSTAYYIYIACARAFGYWLDLICVLFTALITATFLFWAPGSGANAGLAITQSVAITGLLQWGMRQSADLENQMTSVERVLEYSKIEKEPLFETKLDKKSPESWPKKGAISFQNLVLRYDPAEQPVLRDVTFQIYPQEKVGIVGRTGAGKSSLIAALFRLAYIEGKIKIDSLDTSEIGLHDLRSKISIIPQEPVLFSGTLRKNLDPFDEYPNWVLWQALEEVELKEVVSELNQGLDTEIAEGGANFSAGQRQLLCLARAIIRNNKILVMDEATASVDQQTDILIQKTIRRKFTDCTVLTIAHRLNTIMDSDRILVMDSGQVVEFDNPYILLKNKKSVVSSMVEQTGATTSKKLKSIAKKSYNLKLRREKAIRMLEEATSIPSESSSLTSPSVTAHCFKKRDQTRL